MLAIERRTSRTVAEPRLQLDLSEAEQGIVSAVEEMLVLEAKADPEEPPGATVTGAIGSGAEAGVTLARGAGSGRPAAQARRTRRSLQDLASSGERIRSNTPVPEPWPSGSRNSGTACEGTSEFEAQPSTEAPTSAGARLTGESASSFRR